MPEAEGGAGIPRAEEAEAAPAGTPLPVSAVPEAAPGAGAVPSRRWPLRRLWASLRWPSPTRWHGPAADALVLLLLLALDLLFYRAPLFSGRIAADPTLMRLVYPYRQYLAMALREGRLPLWNPYLFTGVPFQAEPQAAVLYPPNLLLRWRDAPEAVALSVAGHGLLAAAGMYLLLRVGLGLVRPAALTGAALFAFGGFLGANAVEPNLPEAAAWLPLVLLGALLACRRAWAAGVCLAAVALALQVLAGALQVVALTLLALVLLLVWCAATPTAGTVATRWRAALRRLRSAGRAATAGLGIVALAAALAAAQLLPSWELYRRSLLAEGLRVPDLSQGALPPELLLRALLPGFNENPERALIGSTGIIALGLAVAGLRGARGAAVFGLLVAAVGLTAALAGATPVFRAVHAVVPGGLPFPQPARALLLVGFGVALAAATGLDALWPGAERRAGLGRWPRRGAHAALALALAGLAWLLVPRLGALSLPSAGVRQIWVGLGVVALDVAVLLPAVRPRRWIALLVAGAALAEVLVAGAQLPFTRLADRAAFAVRPALAALLQGADGPVRVARVTDVPEGDVAPWLAEYRAARAGRDRLLPDAGLLDGVNTLDGLHTALIPPRDVARALGADSPAPALTPGRRPAEDRGTAVVSGSGVEGRTLGELADAEGPLGPRLGVTHVLAPARPAVRVGPLEFLPGNPVVLSPGARYQVELTGERAATGVALLTELLGPYADGQPAAEVSVVDVGGGVRRRTLLAGSDTAAADRVPPGGGVVLPDGRTVVVSEQPLGRAAVFRSLTLSAAGPATLVLHALTLYDERSGAVYPVPLDQVLQPLPGVTPPLYVDRRRPSRAALVHTFTVDPDVEGTIARLAQLPPDTVVLDRAPRFPEPDGGGPTAAIAGETVRIARYAPERVEVLVTAAAPGVFVLRDSAYPGWRALLDGEPAPLLRADGIFRAVAVPAGMHSVVFEFRPRSLRLGAVVSLAALAVVGGVILLGRGRLWRGVRGSAER